ncbi:hypothetical protein T484DRAFT_1770876, partial [Baffinella frigidus]
MELVCRGVFTTHLHCGVGGTRKAVTTDRLASASAGVFTTHLHEIFTLPLNFTGVSFMRMDIQQAKDKTWHPTWRLVPGRSIDSLAFLAAQR